MLSQEAFQKLPIFITTMSRWDGDVSSASLALAKVLSKHNTVYYIDYPYSWADVWRERSLPTVKRRMKALLFGKDYLVNIPGQSDNFVAVTPKPALPIYSLPAGKLYDFASAYNDRQLSNVIKRICHEKGIKEYLFINSFNPTYLSNVGKYLSPTLSIYHSRDAIEEVPGHGLVKENSCVTHYDMSMATSKQLCRNISARNNKPVNYFPNGGDVHLFKKAILETLPKPKELENINTPIIGYTGAVCQRIDYDLMVKIAQQNLDKTIVIVGPRKDKEFTKIKLDDYKNIVFVGSKRIEELPAFLQYFDCTIIPFVKNNLTGGIYPLKINEYLAAGKAVVTTNFSEDIASFEKYIYLANNHEDFLSKIALAMNNNSTEQKHERLSAAMSNAWENRMKLLWDLAWDAYQNKASV
jgi:teichuronic acid biosynthesis glycosyltransferase TuaH